MAEIRPELDWKTKTVQNGEIADADNLNKGPLITRQDLDALWYYITMGQNEIQNTFIDDANRNDASITDKVLSISGIHGVTFQGGTWT
jgi:cyanophycinase-like exopeptidase